MYKVIEFKANGNEFKYSNKELVQFSKNVYLSKEVDEYECKDIYFHNNGVFAYVDRLPKGFETEEQKERLEGIANNLLDFYLNKSWVNVVDIEFSRLAGFGYESLIDKRKELEVKREVRREEEVKQRLEKEQKEIQETEAKLKEVKQKFLSDEYVSYKDLALLADANGFKIHPRTKGVILSLGSLEVKESSGYFPKKTKSTTKESIFKVVAELKKHLTN